MRIGHGYDVHRFEKNRPLILGGVHVPYAMGLTGHSDADIVAHVAMDCLLGALALGDIGQHFPDTDSTFKNANSMELLRQCYRMVQENGYILSNMDITLVAQEPKLAEFIPAMRKNLSQSLNTALHQISIKATTEEKLGFTGQLLGISAHSVCLIKKDFL